MEDLLAEVQIISTKEHFILHLGDIVIIGTIPGEHFAELLHFKILELHS